MRQFHALQISYSAAVSEEEEGGGRKNLGRPVEQEGVKGGREGGAAADAANKLTSSALPLRSLVRFMKPESAEGNSSAGEKAVSFVFLIACNAVREEVAKALSRASEESCWSSAVRWVGG